MLDVHCIDGHGRTQPHQAEGWLCAPDGRKIAPMCRADAAVVIAEYAAQLGWAWTFSPREVVQQRGAS